MEYKKTADKFQAVDQALWLSRDAPDGLGLSAPSGLLAKLRAAADDLAAVQVVHAAQ